MKKLFNWCIKNTKKIYITDIVLLVLLIGLLVSAKEPAQVTGLAVNDSTYSTASISWDAAENAKAYRVYRSVNGGDFEYLLSTADTSYKDTKLRTGDTYDYAISSRNALRTSSVKQAETTEAVPSLESPKLDIDTSTGEIELKFADVDGAISYEIVRDGEVIDTIKGTSYIDSDAKSDVKYNYEVRAVRYKKNPVFSEFSNKKKGILHSVQNFKVATSDKDLVFSWTPSDYYKTYKLYDGDELLTETGDGEYRISDYNMDDVYDMKLVGYADDNTQSPETTKRFIVTEEEMTNEDAREAACEWAADIANDNSFSYGTGKRSHRFGCYFCGTNVGPRMDKKGKSLVSGHSYAKTYCCNPFVTACYAHGAGDPGLLGACSNGRGLDFSPGAFTKYGSWKNIGKPSVGSLQKGDVIVWRAHMMIYIGDGQVAQAKTEGWGAGTIDIDRAASYYRPARFVMRYTGNGRGVKTVIKDVDYTDADKNAEKDADKDKDENKGAETENV